MMTTVTWADRIEEWEQNPIRLRAEILQKMLEAGFDIQEPAGFQAEKGKVTMYGSKDAKRDNRKVETTCSCANCGKKGNVYVHEDGQPSTHPEGWYEISVVKWGTSKYGSTGRGQLNKMACSKQCAKKLMRKSWGDKDG